jgi:polysaccharide export outer membrane protein
MARTILAILGLVLALPCASRAQQDVATARTEAPLVPGDLIRINIWREPDLTGEFLVQEDGTAVLPRIGPVNVTGYTPATLKQNLVTEYSKTLINPSIEVVVLRRILITGEVGGEGVYPVDPTMSLVEVLALAGGPAASAKKDEVILVRDGREIEIDLDDPIAVRDVALRSGDQLVVPRANTWIRNWQVMLGVISSTISLAVLLSRNR